MAASRDVSVHFEVHVGGESFLVEPPAVALPADVGERSEVHGRISIRRVEVDGPVVAPEDDLVPLVFNLCCRAVVSMVEELHAVIRYTNTYGYLRLDAEGDEVRLSGDGLPDVRFPLEPLLDELVDCADRFVAWLPASGFVVGDNTVKRLTAATAAARQVVGR